MKVWQGFGSEHSMNLVMIGHFKKVGDAKRAQEIIEKLTKAVAGKNEISQTRYDEDILEIMRSLNYPNVGAFELEQFQYDVNIDTNKNKIVLTTEESDVSAFLKIMLHEGAKIEVFSAHDYPDEEFGRGK